MNNYGLAQGITQGLKSVQEGLITAESIKNNRQAMQQKAQRHTSQMQYYDTKQNTAELELQQLKQQVNEMTLTKTKEKTWEAFESYIDTGDTTVLNSALEKEPKLKQMLNNKGGVAFIDPDDLSDKKKLELGYDKALNIMEYPIVVTKTDGTQGIMDLHKVMASSGVLKQLNKSRAEKVKLRQEEIELANAEVENTTNEIKLEDMQTFLDNNPDSTLADYVNQTKGSSEDMGQYQKQIDTFKRNNPNYTEEELQSYVDRVMQKSVLGVQSNRNEKKDTEMANNQIKAIKLVNSDDYNKDDAIRLETQILNDLDETKKISIKKAISDMTANHKMVVSINRIIKEADKGDVKVDKDAVANAKTYLDKIFGNDVPQSFKNADFDTAGGLLLAGFMKDISGTAVGVAEAERLTRIFAAGDLADEAFVKNAMSKFSSETEEANKILKSNNLQYIPDTAVKLTTYADEAKGEKPTQKSNSITISGQDVPIEKEDDTYVYVRNPKGQLVRIPKGAK